MPNETEIIDKIKQLDSKVKEEETALAQAEGRLEVLMKRLKDEFSVDDIDAAGKKITELKESLERLNNDRAEVEKTIVKLLTEAGVSI